MPQLKYWNGSAWVTPKALKYWDGSQWVEKPGKYWNGSEWVQFYTPRHYVIRNGVFVNSYGMSNVNYDSKGSFAKLDPAGYLHMFAYQYDGFWSVRSTINTNVTPFKKWGFRYRYTVNGTSGGCGFYLGQALPNYWRPELRVGVPPRTAIIGEHTIDVSDINTNVTWYLSVDSGINGGINLYIYDMWFE